MLPSPRRRAKLSLDRLRSFISVKKKRKKEGRCWREICWLSYWQLGSKEAWCALFFSLLSISPSIPSSSAHWVSLAICAAAVRRARPSWAFPKKPEEREKKKLCKQVPRRLCTAPLSTYAYRSVRRDYQYVSVTALSKRRRRRRLCDLVQNKVIPG